MLNQEIKLVTESIQLLRVGKIFDEYELQAKIAAKFDKKGIRYDKEYQLGRGNRVDFLTESGIAVEVKKGKPNRTQLVEQIERYAKFEEVKAVIIVVETSLRVPISLPIDKPCKVIGLQKLWGIAL